jgi:hypothetical protein
MSKNAELTTVETAWLKFEVGHEAEYLGTLSDEDLEKEMDADFGAMTELEQIRLNKAAAKLQRVIGGVLESERAGSDVRSGLRVAADDGDGEDGHGIAAQRGYAPLQRQLAFGDAIFGLGIATKRPREIVIVGKLPKGARMLRIGEFSFALLRTDDAEVTRCQGLGEWRLRELLEASPPPDIELIV